jgi:exodeoxyribonuclease VII large subunit
MLSILSVSEFITQINDIITGEFIIEGEVSQYKISNSKWIFFDLKDSGSTLNCFSTVFMLRQPLEDGMKIRVIGYPKIHEKSGRFSFTVQKVEMVGEGTLQRAYHLLKQKLSNEGMFDPVRKRPIPELSERIGVIASRDSAAWGDFQRILNNRWGGVEMVLRHVAVQGVESIGDIMQAFEEFNTEKELCDVVVLIRGGGSLEDLAAFNSEEVVKAIYHSRIPVIVGVGHERDESLADLVADVRASTPSNAAEIVVPNRKDFIQQLDFEIEHIQQNVEHQAVLHRHRLDQIGNFIMNQFDMRTQRVQRDIEEFYRLPERLKIEVRRTQEMLSHAEVLFKNVDPKRLLRRGFSITRTMQGEIVKSMQQVGEREKIMIELSEGIVNAEVKK